MSKRFKTAIMILLFMFAVSVNTWSKENVSSNAEGVYSSAKELNGKRIGIQTGTTLDTITEAYVKDPVFSYYNTIPDLAAALEANKIDAFPSDEPVLMMMAAEDDQLVILPDQLDSFEFGFAMPKTDEGEKLQAELNAWLEGIQKNGELRALKDKWISGPDDKKTLPDYDSFPAKRGTLTLATEGAYPPMDYFKGNKVTGLEIDLTARFCEARGYGLDIAIISFDGILAAIQTGKADFGAAGIAITPERAESVLFSDPYYEGSTKLAVLRAENRSASGFLNKIKDSFSKTFLRENRWQLFLEGIMNTLIITLASILLGTALGFFVFTLCRNNNPAANAIAGFCMWLVQGMPMVVLLMVLYYVVFGWTSISGMLVAVIGFTLTFGSSVFSLLKMGVGAVDNGQYEAACALGYSDRQTFYKIILPQALPHIMPAYRGEVVSLIKATAIVGYIAVQDLTKMSDLIRSRTYEAFFPLISVTVIYFMLEGLLAFLVGRIEISTDPRRRRPDSILKGVKTDDKN